ncbi:MAG: hypothetical protein HRU78_07565 [Gammaproteobacteria bacterium]|nr:MAG: hypothetical protein HRU78_07565 [Gammaproteobacteria bacterium]
MTVTFPLGGASAMARFIEQVARIEILEGLETLNDLDMNALLEERKMRIAISVYGYLKRMAAI